jgi:hypothetical protein
VSASFQFGLEVELLLVDAATYEPLWHRDLRFAVLNEILEAIDVRDVPLDGLKLEAPHRRAMPFVIEGYHVTDPDFRPIDLHPKGIEIRTPKCDSVAGAVAWLRDLHGRLKSALLPAGYRPVATPFHPREHDFEGRQNKRRYDYWQWAMEAMLTYGPDVNVGLPDALYEGLDLRALDERVNYYAPAMAALTLASPIYRGALWRSRGRVGKSVRTHLRSVVAPALEVHPREQGRFELKVFETAHRVEDYGAMLTLWLEALLDVDLPGRAESASRIYDLGEVARDGLAAETVKERAEELLTRAPETLARHGFDPGPLAVFRERLATGHLPADDVVAWFGEGRSIPALMRRLELR